MEKFVSKTTTEYTYDKEGRIAKEVRTVEEWTEDTSKIKSGTFTGGVVGEGSISIDKDGNTKVYTSKGVPPTATFDANADTSGITHNIVNNLNLPKSTITQLTNEVLKGIEKYQGNKPLR